MYRQTPFIRTLCSFVLLLLVTAVPGIVVAQSTNARLGGAVTDASGAVLSGVKLICRNVATGLSVEATTNAEGRYQFPELPVGQYELTVTQPGFQKLVRGGITLITGQVAEVNLAMQVGAVESTIEVTGDIPLVQTTTATVQTSMTVRQVQELPLNGRNPLQLVALTPGAAITDAGTVAGQQDNRGLSVNGLRTTQNNFRLDGSNYNNRFFGSAPVLPNPDTLEEFTVQSSNYSARSAGAGAAIEMATRTGTNQFHGSAFEFLRNTVLNANDPFLKGAGRARPPFKQNQYGATFGGPVIKDKLFFFGGSQGTKRRAAPTSVTIQSLTAAQRAGDFSATTTPIIDPFTGQQFVTNGVKNVIPAARIDAVAKAVLDAYLPLPNAGGNNLVVLQNRNIDDDQVAFRADYQLSERNRLTGRLFWNDNDFQRAFTAPNGFFAANNFHNQSYTIRDTHTFSPNLTATFSGAWAKFRRVQEPQAPGLKTLQTFGVKPQQSIKTDFFPGVRFRPNAGFSLFSGGGLEQTPQTYDFHAAAIWTKGRHTVQFGSDFQFDRVFTLDASFTPGEWGFNGSRTGVLFADVILGLPNSYLQDSGRTNDLSESKYHFWVQDDWKVSPRLTLNLGLRYEPWLPPTDSLNNLVGFIAGQQSTAAPKAPLGLLYPGDTGIPETLFKHDLNNFAPRFGFALDVFGNGKSVVRGGYGIFFIDPALTLYTRTVSTQPSVYTVNQQFAANSLATFVDPFAGIPGGNPFPYPRVQPDQFKTFNFILPVSGGVLDPNTRSGYSQNWNFTVEQQLLKDLALSVAYVGNHGVKILGARELNPALPNSAATVAALNNRRIFNPTTVGLSAVEVATPWQYSIYHSLQLGFTKRTSRGLTLLGNYVWSKAIDNGSSTVEGSGSYPRNSLNPSLDRAVADFDATHRANISFIYDLPKVEKFGAFAKALLGGWQVNGILALRSGLPFSVKSGSDRSRTGVGQDNADQLVSDAFAGSCSFSGVTLPTKTTGCWFNNTAFAVAALGTFGTAGRNNLRGPGFASYDMALFRNIALTEQFKLQFRAESFNLFNRVNFDLPAAGNPTATNFGKISTAQDPRVFQFGLKFLF
ncbi:MAG: TonB-dependent receptor [Blastocatellia bacterium]